MDMYINGEGTERNKQKAAEKFLSTSKMTMKDLKIAALVKDALYYRFITRKQNGWIETLDTAVKLGKSPSEVVAFLKNPENEESLSHIKGKVEQYWNA